MFNVAGDNKDNVLSVVCHKDESSPHIHAIVTPVDERGCLCAKSFTNGCSVLSKFQTDYAKKLEDLGIERGIPGSSAHHKPNRKYNAEKNKAAKLPEPEPNQSANEYLTKFQEELERRAIEHKIKMDKMERKLRARIDQECYETREELNEEIDNLRILYEEEEKKYENIVENLRLEKSNLEQELDKLKKIMKT